MAKIIELHYELLSYIMILLVQSSNGAADFARISTVCKSFSKFAEDEDVLKAVAFCDLRISSRYQLFQQINGLLNRCAVVGNVVAQFLLAKTILLSTTELLESERKTVGQKLGRDHGKTPTSDTQVGSFILHFMPNISLTTESSSPRLPHYELVKLFLCLCSPQCLAEMGVHLTNYVDYFTGFGNPKSFSMQHMVNQMSDCANEIMTLKDGKDIRDVSMRLDVFVRLVHERRREPRPRPSTIVAPLGQIPGTARQARERGESSSGQGRNAIVAPLGPIPGTGIVERGDSSSEQGRRYELLADVIMECGTGITGGDFDAIVLERYMEDLMDQFEDSRAEAFDAFSCYFT